MAGDVIQVSKRRLECVLVHAMLATKNIRAQRDRLLQLRRQLPQEQSPGDAAAAAVQEVASGLHKIYSVGLHYGTCYLADCLETAVGKGGGDSFGTAAFTVIPYEQLYGVLLAQWHPLCPATQAQAFARIENAYYAAMLPLDHHLPRCIELLVGVRPPAVHGDHIRPMTGYSEDLVAAANEHLVAAAKEYQARRLEAGFPDPDPVAAANEHLVAAATGEPLEAASSVDLDQALSYLHRACSLTTLAVTFISNLLDPEEVAKISEHTDQGVYISEDRRGWADDQSDNLD